MSTNSPNMALPISTVAVDSGLNWENNLNSALTILDGHNHAAGSGVQITPAGLNINADLAISKNNLTLARSIRFSAQASPLNLATDLGCLYVSGVDLWYNDESGNQVKITSGGSVNATSSGITSGTATASFVSSVLVVNASSNKPANIQAGSILLGNNTVGTNFLTLAPPTAMGASFGLTLPSLPASTLFVTLDTSGNFGTTNGIQGTQIASASLTGAQLANATITGTQIAAATVTGGSGGNIASATITQANISASANITGTQLASNANIQPGQLFVPTVFSANISSYSNSTTSFTNVITLAVTGMNGGRPCFIMFSGFSSGYIGTNQQGSSRWRVVSGGGATTYSDQVINTGSPTVALAMQIPPGCLNTTGNVSGSVTFALQAMGDGVTSAVAANLQMTVFQV